MDNFREIEDIIDNVTNVNSRFDTFSEIYSHFNNETNEINETNETNDLEYEHNNFHDYTFPNVIDNLNSYIDISTNYYTISNDNDTYIHLPLNNNIYENIEDIYNVIYYINEEINNNYSRQSQETLAMIQSFNNINETRTYRNNTYRECKDMCIKTIYSSENNYKNDICPILYESFQDNDNVWVLPCQHIIHESKFEEYISRFDYCPLCMDKILR